MKYLKQNTKRKGKYRSQPLFTVVESEHFPLLYPLAMQIKSLYISNKSSDENIFPKVFGTIVFSRKNQNSIPTIGTFSQEIKNEL